MNTTILIIAYRYWIHLPEKQLALYLRKVCKVIRDETDDDDDKLVCRKVIKTISAGRYGHALKSISQGELWLKLHKGE